MRPCVALLHSFDEVTGANEDPEVTLIPRLDAQEVAAVFTAPFHNFLRARDEVVQPGNECADEWYLGAWTEWHQSNWRSMISFFFSFKFLFPAFVRLISFFFFFCLFDHGESRLQLTPPSAPILCPNSGQVRCQTTQSDTQPKTGHRQASGART